MWRGRPLISSIRNENAFQRGASSRPRSSSTCSGSIAPHESASRAMRSISPWGSASALPRSRIAPRRLVGGERGHQRGVLGAVSLDHVQHQPLAHVAGEVEVDVGHAGQILGQEPAQEQARLHRVDVGEPDQVAHDRADAGAAATAGRKQPAAGASAAHAHRHRARHLEDVAVQQKEPGQPVMGDQAAAPVPAACGPRRPCRCRRSGGRARPGTAAPAPPGPARRYRRSRDSGSPDPGSGRTGSGRRPRPRRGRPRAETAGPRRSGRAAPTRGFPAAPLRTRPAWCCSGSRPARPAERRGEGSGRARRRCRPARTRRASASSVRSRLRRASPRQ